MTTARRTYGTGSLTTRKDQAGRETYYGRFYAHGHQVKVRLGLKRQPGAKVGLTKREAERQLQKLIDRHRSSAPRSERVDIATAGERYLVHLADVMKRKPSTVQDYRIMLTKHLCPFFGGRSLDRVEAQLVADYLVTKQRAGLSSKTVANQLTFLHGVFRYAMKKGWAHANPVAVTDRPQQGEADPDIRYLSHEELEALLRAVIVDDEFAGINVRCISPRRRPACAKGS
jgi:hypothetical protein